MPTTFKYVKALVPVNLLNGALWLEEEDIARIPEAIFNTAAVQDAILSDELVEVDPEDLPSDVVSPQLKLRGDWDPSNGQLPSFRRVGDTYLVSEAGTVNSILLEPGMRVLFTALDTFEIMGTGGVGTIPVPEISWVHKTEAFAVTNGGGYLLDFSGGMFDISLPADPAEGYTVHFWHIEGNVETADPKPQLLTNGKDIMGVAGDMSFNLNFQRFTIRFSEETGDWRFDKYISTNDLGIAGLSGETGEKGDTGDQGPIGDTGNQGPAGNPAVIKGYVGTYNDLLLLTPQAGHCYTVLDTGHLWGYDGTDWNDGGKIAGDTGGTGGTGSPGAVANLLGSVSTYTDLALLTPDVADAWIVQDEGNLYIWDGATWNNVGEIVGPQGLPGPFTKIIGSVPNEAALPGSATDGDTYIAQDTGDGHQWYDAQWNNIGQIKGDKGDTGDTGDTGPAGTSISIGNAVADSTALNALTPVAGETRITLDDGHLHFYNGSSWIDNGKIVGEKGDTGIGTVGDTGPEGPEGPSHYTVKEITTGVTGYSEVDGEVFYVLNREEDRNALLLFDTTMVCHIVLPTGLEMTEVIPAEVDANARTDWPEGAKVYSRNKQTGQIRLVIADGSTDVVIGGFISVDPQALCHFYLEEVLTSSTWVGALNFRNELAPVIDENNPLTNLANEAGDKVFILFDEEVTGSFNAADWTLLSNGQEITVTAMTIDGRLIELSATPLFEGHALELYYTGTSLEGVSTGNPVQEFSTIVENGSVLTDSSPFVIVSAEVMPSGTETRVLLSKTPSLSVADTAENRLAGWVLVVDGRNLNLSSATFDGREVVLTHETAYEPIPSSSAFLSYAKYIEEVQPSGGFVTFPAASQVLEDHISLAITNSSIAPWVPTDLGVKLIDYGMAEPLDFIVGTEGNIRSGADGYNNYVNDVTPIKSGAAFTIVSQLVTVTDVGHGLSTGDSVTVISTSPVVAGTTPIGRWVTVLDDDTFTFIRPGAGNATGTLSYRKVIEEAPIVDTYVRWWRGRKKVLTFTATGPANTSGTTPYDRPGQRKQNAIRFAFNTSFGMVTQLTGDAALTTTDPILVGTSTYIHGTSGVTPTYAFPGQVRLVSSSTSSYSAGANLSMAIVSYESNFANVYFEGTSTSISSIGANSTDTGFKSHYLYTDGTNYLQGRTIKPASAITGSITPPSTLGVPPSYAVLNGGTTLAPSDIRRWIIVKGTLSTVELDRLTEWIRDAYQAAN